MKTKRLPKSITIKFTEKDRQKAESYNDHCGCLVATALTRMGFKRIFEHVYFTEIQGKSYSHPEFGPREAKKNNYAQEKPFYRPSIVGKKLKLTRTP